MSIIHNYSGIFSMRRNAYFGKEQDTNWPISRSISGSSRSHTQTWSWFWELSESRAGNRESGYKRTFYR